MKNLLSYTLCFIGFHNWSRWETIVEGDLIDDKKAVVGCYVRQKRTCAACNIVAIRDANTR